MDSNHRSPGHDDLRCRPCRTVGCEGWGRGSGRRGSARFLLLGEPFHGTDRPYGFGRLRFVPLLELLRALAHVLVVALARKRLLVPVQELRGRFDLVVVLACWRCFRAGPGSKKASLPKSRTAALNRPCRWACLSETPSSRGGIRRAT